MLKFNDYLKEAALSAKQKKIAAVAGDKDKIDAADLAALRKEETELDESAGLPHALMQVGKDKWHIYDTKTQKVHSTYNNKNVAMKKYGELNDKHAGYDTLGGLVKSKFGVRKEEVELDEGRVKELAMDLKDMSHDEFHKQYGKPKSHYDPKNFKKPVEPGKGMDRARALAQRGMQSLSKEEVEQEMSAYVKSTLAVMDEGKIDNLRDAQKLRQDNQSAYSKGYKPDTSHPHIQVVKGTAYGGENQKDDEGDEKPDDEKQEKKGRGRPAGKVGKYKARGSKSAGDGIDDREYQLHLPNNK